MPDKVTLVHKDLDETIAVAEHAVPIHVAAGWKVAPTTKQPREPEPDKS